LNIDGIVFAENEQANKSKITYSIIKITTFELAGLTPDFTIHV